MKIRAAVLETMGAERPYDQSNPLTIAELDLAGPGPGEVLVKVAAAGLCHSDLSVIDGNRPRPTPMALGHEASGIVEEVGAGVTSLQSGDHVVMVFVPSCGHCVPCAEGRPALCEPAATANGAGTLLSGGRRLSRDAAEIHHHLGVSAFAEYATVSENSLVKISKEFDLTTAALFGCAVLTGFGAVVNTGRVPPGASVAVVGLGGVGLCALLGAKASGVRQLIAVDLADDKLELAQSLGATNTVNAAAPDALDEIKALSHGGVDFAFEMAGSVKALQLAYEATKRGGTTVTAGLPHPAHKLDIAAVSLVAEERTLKGSYVGACVPRRDLPRYLDLFSQGQLPVDRLLTDTMPLEDINLGFERLASWRQRAPGRGFLNAGLAHTNLAPATHSPRPFAPPLTCHTRKETMHPDFFDLFNASVDLFGASTRNAANTMAATMPTGNWFDPFANPADVNGVSPPGMPPFFDAAFGNDRKLARYNEAAATLADAIADYNMLWWRAWTGAWQEFSSAAATSSTPPQSIKDGIDEWLAFANDSMLELQHSSEFLAAQRGMLNAVAEFRAKQRELLEMYLEANQIPTRTDMDDLSRTVYEMKREMRSIRRELAKAQRANTVYQTENPAQNRTQKKAEPTRHSEAPVTGEAA